MNGKTILEFYPLDIDYTIDKHNDTVVRVYGITEEGKKVVALDNSFQPCFYAIFDKDSDLERMSKVISEIKMSKEGRIIAPTKIEISKLKYRGCPTNAIKIYGKSTSDLYEIKEIVKLMPEFEKHAELDIGTAKEYLVSKEITPLSKIRVTGNLFDLKKYRSDYIINIQKIEEVEKSTDVDANVIAFDIETYNPIGTPRPKSDPVIAISLADNKGHKKVLTWKRFENPDSCVEFVGSEMELLERFSEVLKEAKPDFLVTYNGDNFDFPYLKERANRYKLKFDIGIDHSDIKFKRRGMGTVPKIRGCVNIDLYTFIRNTLSPTLKTEVYSLDAVAQEILGDKKKDGVHWENMQELWDTGGEGVKKITEYCMHDSVLTVRLFQKVAPMLYEMTRLIGQPPYDVSRMSYGKSVEWYLIKNSKSFNEIVPKKPAMRSVSNRDTKTYAGAYVHEPKPGLYDNIVVYDFASLYPSIILSHNVCPTTMDCKCCGGNDCHITPEIDGETYRFCKNCKGFVPAIIEDLITRRTRIKEILKTMDKGDEQKRVLSARSYALKTIANSMYGYLGFSRSRWYCIKCAASITAWGRHYITKVIEDAKANNFEIIYGDTDSVMVSLGERSQEESKKFFEEINKKLPGIMKLDFEGFFKRGIFVTKKIEAEKGAKKKYALAEEDGDIIVKGFEFVRRDWSKISKDTQMDVLKAVLLEGSKDKAVDIIKKTLDKLKNHEVSLEEVAIYTQLKRKIEDYESIGPHVAAAIKAREHGYSFEPGHIIKYIITKGQGSISDRAMLIEEVEKADKPYDAQYYIDHQVLPAVEKIFEVLGYTKDELKGKIQTKLEGFFK